MAFDKLKKQAAVPKNVKWSLPAWGGDGEPPWFRLEFATSDNPAWMKARIAWETSDEGKRITKLKDSPYKFDQLREIDYKLFAQVLVKDWGNVPADVGDGFEKFDASDVKKIEEVLRALPQSSFDDLRGVARSPEKADAEAAKELGGNSQTSSATTGA